MTEPAIQITTNQAVAILDSLRAQAGQVEERVRSVRATATDPRFVEPTQERVTKAAALAVKIADTTAPARSFVTGTSDLSDDTAAALDGAKARPTALTPATGKAAVRMDDSAASTASRTSAATEIPTRDTTVAPVSASETSKPAATSASESTPVTDSARTSTGTAPASGSASGSAPRTVTESSGAAPVSAAEPARTSPVSVEQPVAAPAAASTQPVPAINTAGMTGPQVMDRYAPQMLQSYPPPPPASHNPQLNAGLTGGSGNRQPADTIYLTDNQTRILAEAIAHNINSRRRAQAEAAAGSAIPLGGVDGMGGFGGTSDMSSINLSSSNGYHDSVLMLAEQLVNMQPPIPYAWGGGSLQGPSQGISDGGGYADACGDYNKIGFDCSGLSRYVTYQTLGEEIPRTSQPQYSYCIPVAHPMIGDLGFPAGGSPGHVVVYVGGGTVFEAQQSGTFLMFSPAQAGYVWGRPQTSPNWQIEAEGGGGY